MDHFLELPQKPAEDLGINLPEITAKAEQELEKTLQLFRFSPLLIIKFVLLPLGVVIALTALLRSQSGSYLFASLFLGFSCPGVAGFIISGCMVRLKNISVGIHEIIHYCSRLTREIYQTLLQKNMGRIPTTSEVFGVVADIVILSVLKKYLKAGIFYHLVFKWIRLGITQVKQSVLSETQTKENLNADKIISQLEHISGAFDKFMDAMFKPIFRVAKIVNRVLFTIGLILIALLVSLRLVIKF